MIPVTDFSIVYCSSFVERQVPDGGIASERTTYPERCCDHSRTTRDREALPFERYWMESTAAATPSLGNHHRSVPLRDGCRCLADEAS